jgi:hypothetical protein
VFLKLSCVLFSCLLFSFNITMFAYIFFLFLCYILIFYFVSVHLYLSLLFVCFCVFRRLALNCLCLALSECKTVSVKSNKKVVEERKWFSPNLFLEVRGGLNNTTTIFVLKSSLEHTHRQRWL